MSLTDQPTPADHGHAHPDARRDPDADELREPGDREELRQRYYGLLQELRVVLPGVQVLLAFLLTVPFANRFVELDDVGRDLYGVSLVTTALSVVVLLTPTALHRFGDRSRRRRRLVLAVACTRIGLALLAVSIVSAVVVVTRFVFGDTASGWAGGLVGVTVVVAWIGMPALLHWSDDEDDGAATPAERHRTDGPAPAAGGPGGSTGNGLRPGRPG